MNRRTTVTSSPAVQLADNQGERDGYKTRPPPVANLPQPSRLLSTRPIIKQLANPSAIQPRLAFNNEQQHSQNEPQALPLRFERHRIGHLDQGSRRRMLYWLVFRMVSIQSAAMAS